MCYLKAMGSLVQKSFLLARCFFSLAVHNIMALVEKIQRAQQENRLCKHVYTGGLLNYTAYVNFTFTQMAYNKNCLCKYH